MSKMESVSSNPIKLTERDQEQREEQLRIQREEEESRTVEISHPRTRIQGVLRQSTRFPSLEYIAFLGIPYALPPVGKLRFQPPQRQPQLPPDRPTRPFIANNGSHPCTQRVMDENIGSEDCLYLNVFTPRKPNDSKLSPVLVYIHGGGFIMCENNVADPENLIREGLVVVTINYRLGIFGFLNMRTESCVGNAGMKDQVMALEWVRDNIEPFKGNPKNVTICGSSAGASCVNLHMFSPLSKGLFHKAIVMGGGVYSPWGYGGHAKHHVQQFIKSTIFQSKELRDVAVDILKQKKTFDLLKLGEDTMNTYITKGPVPMKMSSFFKPSVECVKEGAFLPDTIEKLMAAAVPVPTIAGITKQEGYMFFSTYASEVIKMMKGEIKFVELVKDVIQQNFSWKDPMAVDRHFEFFKDMYFPEDGMLEVGKTVKDDGENRLTTEEERQRKDEEKQWKEEERKHRLATLFTDIFFRQFYDNFKIGNLLDEEGPNFYVYEFDYFAGEPLDDDDQNLIRPRAAGHADDYFYVFGPIYVDKMLKRMAKKDYDRVRTEIESVQINMSSLWSSFCRTGDPTSCVKGDANVIWKPHTEQDPHYLRIGKELTLKKGCLNEGRWPPLNAICQLEPTIPSLPVSPKTPKMKSTDLPQPQPELGSSSTQAPETECEVVRLSRPKPDSSTSQTPDTEYEISQLSQPEPEQPRSQTSVEEVECKSTYEIVSDFSRVTENL